MNEVSYQWSHFVYRIKCAALDLNDPFRRFPGLLSRREGLALCKLARSLPDGAVMVEIGCYAGLSAAFLLEGAKNNKAFLYSLDPFDSELESQLQDPTNFTVTDKKIDLQTVETRLKKHGLENFLLIQGFSFDIVEQWDKVIHLLWIDGNHEYESVRDDYLRWGPFICKGGIIAFHDSNQMVPSEKWTRYGWPGPTRLVNEFLTSPKWKDVCRVDSITFATKVY
jgi:predicted O-methyltransferase YrrM